MVDTHAGPCMASVHGWCMLLVQGPDGGGLGGDLKVHYVSNNTTYDKEKLFILVCSKQFEFGSLGQQVGILPIKPPLLVRLFVFG